MPDTLDISQDFEDRHNRGMARAANDIRAIYEDAMTELAYSTIVFSKGSFSLSQAPLIRKLIAPVAEDMQARIYAVIVNSIKSAWDLSNAKNDILMDRRLAGKEPSKAIGKLLYDPNKSALEAFIKRKEGGLNLSQRVWNTLDPFKAEMEAALSLGIQEGKSAAKMATTLKSYLNEPDRLYRRLREIKGDRESELKLSKAAKEYRPGTGTYRSAYKNSLRLTRTEVNIASRSADNLRWANNPMIKGIEVKLSNNHKIFDVCDNLRGQYPASFKFVGWHPQCRCFQIPILLTDEEFEKYEDALLAGEDLPEVKGVEDIPERAKEWIEQNRERLEGLKNKPYWMRDNADYVNGKAKAAPVPEAPKKPAFVPAKTVKEAEDWAKANLKAEIETYKGFDLDVANQINQTLFDIEQQYLKPVGVTIGSKVSGKAYAQYDWNANVLNLRKKYDNIEGRRAADNTQWRKQYGQDYHASTTLDGLIKHEYAHAFDNLTNRAMYNELSKLDLEIKNQLFGVSGYASSDRFYATGGKTEGSEMIAEVISAKLTGSPKYQKLPTEARNIIDKYFK